jgi:hypothetical protein
MPNAIPIRRSQAPRTCHPAGAQPQPPALCPSQLCRSLQHRHLFLRSTYPGQAELLASPGAFLAFLPPSSSFSCWQPPGALALASGSSSHRGCLSPRAHGCLPVSPAAVVTASAAPRPQRMVPVAPRVLSLGRGLEVAVNAPLPPPRSRRSARVPSPRQPQVHQAG